MKIAAITLLTAIVAQGQAAPKSTNTVPQGDGFCVWDRGGEVPEDYSKGSCLIVGGNWHDYTLKDTLSPKNESLALGDAQFVAQNLMTSNIQWSDGFSDPYLTFTDRPTGDRTEYVVSVKPGTWSCKPTAMFPDANNMSALTIVCMKATTTPQ